MGNCWKKSKLEVVELTMEVDKVPMFLSKIGAMMLKVDNLPYFFVIKLFLG